MDASESATELGHVRWVTEGASPVCRYAFLSPSYLLSDTLFSSLHNIITLWVKCAAWPTSIRRMDAKDLSVKLELQRWLMHSSQYSNP